MVPWVPLAQTTLGETTLKPRSSFVVPLSCCVQNALSATVSSITTPAYVSDMRDPFGSGSTAEAVAKVQLMPFGRSRPIGGRYADGTRTGSIRAAGNRGGAPLAGRGDGAPRQPPRRGGVGGRGVPALRGAGRHPARG